MNKIIIIATPIGNLEDITLRSLEALKNINIVICENIGTIKKLMQKYEIDYQNKQFIQYNDKSDHVTRSYIFNLKFTEAVLVSDAGTPLISDPGYKLIREAIDLKFEIDYLPGPSAAIMALVLSGFSSDKFLFLGFLPKKGGKRLLEQYIDLNITLILYESRYRIEKTLDLIFKLNPDANVAILREGTKFHQEVIRFNNDSRPILKLKGEFSLCVH